MSPAHRRGASFGLRQSLDTVGAFLGPLFAIGLMWWTVDHFQVVFWAAVIPAFMALALIIYAVREPERSKDLRKVRNPLSLDEMRAMGSAYWAVVVIGVVFTLARFSEAFLVLRAQNVGLPIMWVPAVMVVMNIVYALAAYPAGVLSDRTNRMMPLKLGLVLLIAADIVLALMPTFEGVAIGVMLWGLHMGFTQGLFATLVADASPPELRGTAYGFFNLFTGLAMLAASIIAGGLWDVAGPKATFLAGAGFAVLAFVGVVAIGARMMNAVVK
jgi:MFS family permease